MAFLLLTDYAVQIKTDLLKVITDDSEAVRTAAEHIAQTEMEGYLRGRYDLPACFIDVVPYVGTLAYLAGALVLVPAVPATQGSPGTAGTPAVPALLYVATRATAAGEAPGAPAAAGQAAAWLQQDPRHALLKMYLIDATLYHLHSRQNPASVPEVRRDRYDQVISWLQGCRTGKVSPGLPLLADKQPDGTPTRESIRPRGGSLPKLTNSY